jgi:hypothetical protein
MKSDHKHEKILSRYFKIVNNFFSNNYAYFFNLFCFRLLFKGRKQLFYNHGYFTIPYLVNAIIITIPGVTSYYSLKKRNYKEYLNERVLSLLIPFISAMILLNPILSYFGMKFSENLPISY